MLKLKLQYFGHLMQTVDSGKNPDAGRDWGKEEKGATEDEMVGWHTDSMDMSLSKLWDMAKIRESWHTAVHGISKGWTGLSDLITFFYPCANTMTEIQILSQLLIEKIFMYYIFVSTSSS